MRTTVTLDPDTAALLRQEVARRHVSFKQVINDAIRRGLTGLGSRKRQSVEVLAFRSAYQPGVDRRRLQQMADEIEADRDADRAKRRS
jgi:hypothetical protein